MLSKNHYFLQNIRFFFSYMTFLCMKTAREDTRKNSVPKRNNHTVFIRNCCYFDVSNETDTHCTKVNRPNARVLALPLFLLFILLMWLCFICIIHYFNTYKVAAIRYPDRNVRDFDSSMRCFSTFPI